MIEGNTVTLNFPTVEKYTQLKRQRFRFKQFTVGFTLINLE